jgi:hypothetical protein
MSNVETLPVAASNSSSKQGQFEPLTVEEIRKINAYWRACNYLSAGMLYLCSNPLLREPLKPEHIKNRRQAQPHQAARRRWLWRLSDRAAASRGVAPQDSNRLA